MFWENFVTLCSNHNTTPTAVVDELKLSRGSVTNWKNGKTPRITTQQKIADRFGVDVAYFSIKSKALKFRSENEDKNTVIIMGRDGQFTKKELSDEQINALKAIVEQMPDASEKDG